jgi:hypothetical protein
LADDADTALLLNEEEKKLVVARRAKYGTTNEFTWAGFRAGMKGGLSPLEPMGPHAADNY